MVPRRRLHITFADATVGKEVGNQSIQQLGLNSFDTVSRKARRTVRMTALAGFLVR